MAQCLFLLLCSCVCTIAPVEKEYSRPATWVSITAFFFFFKDKWLLEEPFYLDDYLFIVKKKICPAPKDKISFCKYMWNLNVRLLFFNFSVMSNFLQPHGLQDSLSFPISQSLLKPMFIELVMPYNHLILCHPLLLPSSIFPSIRVFPKSHLFPSGDQSIGVSASTLVLPVNIQDWFPLGWTGCISLQSKGLSRVFSNTTVQKDQFFGTQLSLWSNTYIHTQLLEKTIALTRMDLCWQSNVSAF